MAIRMHLAMCRHCRRFIRQVRATVALLARAGKDAPAPTPEREAALLEIFRRER